jgi:hypothetical protein
VKARGASAARRWRVPFFVRKLHSKWCVLERHESSVGLVSFCDLVSHWDTREQAREAVRQLNQEERRYA